MNNPLDNLFRDQLRDHEIKPDDHVWEAISSNINKSSRNIWPILAPILILVGAAAIYFINNTTTSPNKENPKTEVEHTPLIKDESSVRPQEAFEAESEIASEGTAAENTPAASQENTQKSEFISSASIPNRSKENLNTNSGSQKSIPNKQAKVNSKLAADPENSPLSESTPSSTSLSEETIGTASKQSATEKSSTISTAETDNKEKVEDISTSEISSGNSLLRSTSLLQENDEGFHRFAVAHFKATESDHKNALLSADLCALMYPKTNECPTFKDLHRNFQLDVYGLLGKKFSGLSTNANITGVNTYLNKRKTSETPLWNIGFGIRLANQWTNGISLKGGVQFSRGQIRLNYQDRSEVTRVVEVAIDSIIDSMGNITVIVDTLSITETNIVPVEEYNTFTQIDIPLTVGYTFLGRNYDIEINGGVMFNLLFNKRGIILGPEENEVRSIDPAHSNSINAYEQRLGLSIITSAAFNYHLTDQMSVFVEPQLRYFLKPVSPDSYSLRENWFHANLLLGTRYSF